MNDLLFVKRKRKHSRPLKHPYYNSRSKVQRLRRTKERKRKFKAVLQQNVREWLQKCFQENSAIQDMPDTKTKGLLDPVELDEDDLYYFSDFLIFDEPIEETLNDLIKQIEYELENTNDNPHSRKNSECSENEVSNCDNNNSSDTVAKNAIRFLNNSTPNSLNHVNIQINDESIKTELPVPLSNIKKEVDVNEEDLTFSSESCDVLRGETPSIKMETDSQSSFHSRDEILPVNILHVIGQENTSSLNKNYETDSSIIPSNKSCTTNTSTEYHTERNESCNGKFPFVKLEFQEIDCNEYAKTCQQETVLESIHHNTRAHIMEEPKIPKESNRNFKIAAMDGSTKWNGRIVDYSRTNREILNEKSNVKRLVIRNFFYPPQNPLISMDFCEENEMSVKSSRNLMEKNKECTHSGLNKKAKCKKGACRKALTIDVSLPKTTINLEDESYKTIHLFDPDFGKI